MSDNTVLNPGVGGDVIITEARPSDGYKIPVSKIRLGAQDVDGGDVTINNPFPTSITDGINGNAAINSDGSLSVAQIVSTIPNQNTIAASISSVNLLPATLRKGATIFNDTLDILYLILGDTASLTSFTVKINSNGYYETPFNYSGPIAGIWSGTDGFARITELE